MRRVPLRISERDVHDGGPPASGAVPAARGETLMLAPATQASLEQALRGLRYGTIQLVVHDAQVVRIERIERIRLTGSPEALSSPTGRPTPSPEVRHGI